MLLEKNENKLRHGPNQYFGNPTHDKKFPRFERIGHFEANVWVRQKVETTPEIFFQKDNHSNRSAKYDFEGFIMVSGSKNKNDEGLKVV